MIILFGEYLGDYIVDGKSLFNTFSRAAEAVNTNMHLV